MSILRSAIAAAVLLLAAQQAQAISITPLPRVDLKDGVATVRATGDDNMWRAQVFRVVQDDGVESLEPAPDVMVRPELFKAPRGIRIATKKLPDGSKELFYRLILTQQIKADSGQTGLRPKLTISIPVVSAPAQPIGGYKCDEGKITNTGNTHIKLVVENSKPLYVLPGSTMALPAGAVFDDDRKAPVCEAATASAGKVKEAGHEG